MVGERPDFGDSENDYKDLQVRVVSRIPLVIEEDTLVSVTSPDVALALGVQLDKKGRIKEEQYVSALSTKLWSLNNKVVPFIIENTVIEDPSNKNFGSWRVRIDPRTPIFDSLIFKDHSIILDCIRKDGRLKVRRISLQLVQRRPNPSEGILTGTVSVIDPKTSQLSNAYLNPDDFKWLLQLPRRRKKLNNRLKEWDEYISTYLEAIKNKQGWIAYRNIRRINPTQATVEISRNHYSKNAFNSFFREEEVRLLEQPIPDSNDWKLDEDTKEPISLGTLSKEVHIREILENKGKNKNEWVTIKIDLDDDFVQAELADEEIQQDKKVKVVDKIDSLPDSGLLINSILSEVIPFQRQIKAIDRLRNANSANPRLEDFLFDITEANQIIRDEEVDKEKLVETKLNADQLRAIKTALNTPDLTLIQGPPGTGKTTVIAELCNQVALRGGRVLLSSQSNLAVDNALSRLSNKSYIMPIRIGGRVTEEGQEFVEDNVIRRWFRSIRENTERLVKDAESVKTDFDQYQLKIDETQQLLEKKELLLKNEKDLEQEIEEVKQEIILENGHLDGLKESCKNIQVDLPILKKCVQDSVIPEGNELIRLSKLCPEINANINRLISKVLKPIYDDSESSMGELDTGCAIEIMAILHLVEHRKYHTEALLESLLKLIRIAEASAINNEEMNQLSEEQQKILSKMGSSMDKSDMNILTDKLLEINKRIQVLKDKSSENRLNEEWRTSLASLKNALDSFIHIDQLINGDNASIADRIRNLASSYKPDPQYRDIVGILIKTYKEIDSTPFKIDDKSKIVINNLWINLEKELLKLSNEVTSLERRLHSLEAEASNARSCNDRTIKDIAKTNETIEQNLELINRLREKYNTEENGTITPIELKDLNDDTILKLRAEYADSKELRAESINKSVRWNKLKSEWVERINHAERNNSKADYESIKNIYVNVSNVVGATCMETGRYKFWSNYGRDFDLVIIDEVSKATPPELLMPMLLGRQIILVGDHNQLPPTFRLRNEDLTGDEAKDEEEVRDMMKKYEKLVTSSYFEEMFLKADNEIKARLTTQYRMHPAIMDAINQFYPPDYQLVCGIENPEKERSHPYNLKSNGRNLTTDNAHLVWVDSSYKKVGDHLVQNAEGREGGEKRDLKSRYNEYEVDIVAKILLDIDSQFNITTGGRKQPVAVISFYAGQVRLLKDRYNNLLAQGKLKNLDVRIGTVDRFQGMERHIVIASLVSSPDGSNGRRMVTRHVRDFRRINVALSRAQSLLFVVAAADVFRNVPVNVRHEGVETEKYCYSNIIERANMGVKGSCFVRGYELV